MYRKQGSRPFPWEKNAKKAKWLSGEALQIAVKRREAKSKGEKDRYKHLNAEFQRIARRELPYNPAIPLVGIHTEETRIERDTLPQC